MKTKKERFLTPVGEARWAHLAKPKPGFVDAKGNVKGDPKYMIDVVFNPTADPDWRDWAKRIAAELKAVPTQTDKATKQAIPKQQVLKKELDAEDEPTGRWYVTFKTSDKFRPSVFDRFGQPLPEGTLVGNGSRVRVNYTPDTYEAFGGGVTLYLNAVQVVDLVEYQVQRASAYGFEESAPDGMSPTATEDDDDLPF